MIKQILFTLCLSVASEACYAAKPTIWGHLTSGFNSIRPGSNVNKAGLVYYNKIIYQQSVNYKNSDGKTLYDSNGFDSSGFVTQHSFQYTYNNTIESLGQARMHTNITIPLSTMRIRGQASNKDMSGFGDIIFNPLILSWHNYKPWEFMLATAVVIPNADHEDGFGKNFWSYRLAFGFTYYFGEQKDFAFSNLMRIETNTRQQHTQIVPGSELSYEWSLSKRVGSNFELGIVGSHLYQIEDDKGPNTIAKNGSKIYDKDSIHNIGAQIVYYNFVHKYSLSLAYHRDYNAKGRPQFWNIMAGIGYRF